MSIAAFLELETGENLRIRHTNGQLAGKALANFLIVLNEYCSKIGMPAEVQQWFSKLPAQTVEAGSICAFAESWYGGDWNYSENDYDQFRLDAPELQLDKVEFVKAIRQVNQKWTSAALLYSCVDSILTWLQEAKPEIAWWYDPEWTLSDFQALARTLSQAIDKGIVRVRIKLA